jgi:hypothetical protein
VDVVNGATAVRNWRAAHPEAAAEQARKVRLRQRALTMLGQIHDRELAELITYLEEQEKKS